jgi:hypothetical protein
MAVCEQNRLSRPSVSQFAFSGRWPHSGYQSRANVAEGAGLKAQGIGTSKIAVPAWN